MVLVSLYKVTAPILTNSATNNLLCEVSHIAISRRLTVINNTIN